MHTYLGFQRTIILQLYLISQGNNKKAAEFAENVRPRGSALTKLKQARHHPDGSFGLLKAPYPGLVVEVSYSQKVEDLPHLAEDYILGSGALIQVVIGINLEYQKEKGMEAKVFMWRPEWIEEDGATKLQASQKFEGVFRARDGSLANADQILPIQLKDFSDGSEGQEIADIADGITITFSHLYKIVEEAEKTEELSSRHEKLLRDAEKEERRRND
jgi:hypothetical protein